MDRCDIQFAVKELSRHMSSPTDSSWNQLKRLGRYIIGKPRAVSYFRWQEEASLIQAFSDSDWAGCVRTRRSTSGGILMYGSHVVKTWSATQATVALSSGEAEYSADVKGASILLGFRSLLADLGITPQSCVLHR